ncbi:MAG: type II toxin-antitoxin system RelE/ParE family toxin [Opitutaceae bacterium]|jgi:phage-related protein
MLTQQKLRREKFRTVEFYRTADGRKPVADWLNELDDERAQAVAIGVRFFEEYPNPVVPKKFFEKITEHIWEIKTHYGKEQFRLLAFQEDGAIVIAVHGIAKKSMDLKQQEVELAEERRKDYIWRKEQGRKHGKGAS